MPHFIRSLVFPQEHQFWEVRSEDLHFFDLIKVCAHFLQAQRWIDRLTALVGLFRSDSYSHNSCSSDWKAILLNKVVGGKGVRDDGRQYYPHRATCRLRFCERYDHIIVRRGTDGGQILVEVGARLSYEELVVYDNDAIQPSYLVM